MRQVFFPIQPSPARRANARSSTGAVSTQAFDSNGPNSWANRAASRASPARTTS